MGDNPEQQVGLKKRIALTTPGLGRVLRSLDATRRERDRLRRDNVRLRAALAQQRSAFAPDEEAVERTKLELLQAPSFLSRVSALKRVRDHSRELFGHADPVWRYNSKPAGAALAQELGLRVPEKLCEPVPLDALELTERRRCVVKPTSGASARGVVPLVPDGEHAWIDLFDLELGPRSWEQIREGIAEVVTTGRIEPSFFLEEMVAGPSDLELPYDWKSVCIGGRVVLTYCRDARNRRPGRYSRYRYWSADWGDLGRVHHPDRIDPTLPPPRHPDEMTRVAETIANHVDTEFLRVDLFEDAAGVLFSELTPQPGGVLWYGDELDRRFGDLWDRVEARSWHH